MSPHRSLLAWVFVAGCLALLAATASAHEYKLDAVMNAFVKVEADEAHLVIRVPLYLFKSAKFPVKNAEIDLANSAPAIARALAGLQHDVAVFEDGQPLSASKT